MIHQTAVNVSGDAEHLDFDEDVTQTSSVSQQPTLNNKDVTAMKADMVGSKDKQQPLKPN